MSYCMFENTTIEMDQILETMEEATNMEDLNLNRSEKAAFDRLVDQCQAFLKQGQRLAVAEWLLEASEELDEALDLSDSCYGYIDADDLV